MIAPTDGLGQKEAPIWLLAKNISEDLLQGLSTKSDQNYIELEVNLNQTKSEPEPVN